MSNCYGMLKDLVMEYHTTKFPYEISEITGLKQSEETLKVVKRLNDLKDKIFVFAMLYVDEREGIKNDF